MYHLAILIGKLLQTFIRVFNIGGGSVWPGYVASKIYPQILFRLINNLNNSYLVVSGTNGKTTTVRLLDFIYQRLGYNSRINSAGANLKNGAISSLLSSCSWKGVAHSEHHHIFEIDENSLGMFPARCPPQILCLSNLFRDQLDRYGELEITANTWQSIVSAWERSPTLVVNADDPLVAWLGITYPGEVVYFGLSSNIGKDIITTTVADTLLCPRCSSPLEYHWRTYSHLGDWFCVKCGLSRPRPQIAITQWDSISYDCSCASVSLLEGTLVIPSISLSGLFNAYNIASAIAVSVAKGISYKDICYLDWSQFQPAFGRQEEIAYHSCLFKILLSKNPVGFTENLRLLATLSGSCQTLILGLNDHYADGRDISWIYDVDFSYLQSWVGPIYVFGDRFLDLEVCLRYHDIAFLRGSARFRDILPSLNNTNTKVVVLATYTAMLEARKELVGRRLL